MSFCSLFVSSFFSLGDINRPERSFGGLHGTFGCLDPSCFPSCRIYIPDDLFGLLNWSFSRPFGFLLAGEGGLK